MLPGAQGLAVVRSDHAHHQRKFLFFKPALLPPRPSHPHRHTDTGRAEKWTPAKRSGISCSPIPCLKLLSGWAASALIPMASSSRAAVWRTQPLTTTPAQPFCTASSFTASPAKRSAPRHCHPPPAPGQAHRTQGNPQQRAVLEHLERDDQAIKGLQTAKIPQTGIGGLQLFGILIAQVGGPEWHISRLPYRQSTAIA